MTTIEYEPNLNEISDDEEQQQFNDEEQQQFDKSLLLYMKDDIPNEEQQQQSDDDNYMEQNSDDEDDYTLVDLKIPITTLPIAEQLHPQPDCHIKRAVYCECCELVVVVYVLNMSLENQMYEYEWYYYVEDCYIIKANKKINVASLLSKFQLYEHLDDVTLKNKLLTELQFIIDYELDDVKKGVSLNKQGFNIDNDGMFNKQIKQSNDDDDDINKDDIFNKNDNDIDMFNKDDDDKQDKDFENSHQIIKNHQVEYDQNTKGITLMLNCDQDENHSTIHQFIQDTPNHSKVRVNMDRIQLDNDCFNLCQFPFKYCIDWNKCVFKFNTTK